MTADLEIKRAAQLSVAEIFIGSAGHGLKVPLTGQFLSLNQLAFLLNAINRDNLPKSSVFEISAISAVLKSFSPAGQKIGPMLSIATQGFLFWISITIAGTNVVGQILGAILLSLWAFVQPLLTLFMIYGFDLPKLAEVFVSRISEDYSFVAWSLLYAVLGFMFLKMIFAAGMAIYSVRTKKEIVFINEKRIGQSLNFGQTDTAPLKAALKDLFKPLFLFSFVLMLIFVWQLNGSLAQKVWLSLRPLAVAFVLFYLLRSPWVAEKLFKLSKKSRNFERIYLKSKRVLDFVAERATGSSEVSSGRKLE